MAKFIVRPFGYRLLLLLLIFLAFALRLHNLETFSFWTDEALTPLRSGYSLAEILSNRIVIQEGVTRDTHPPLFYLIIHFTRQLFGESDFAYRYPASLAGVLLVPLLFQFGRRLQGITLGIVTTLLVAINPLQIWYANEARMYTVFVLLAAAATYSLWRALSGQKLVRYLILYILSAGLALYTHYSAVFLIAAQSLFWAWLLWRNGQRRLLLGTAAVAVLLTVPLIPFTLPRLFTGAEANYFYVSPHVMLVDVLHAFNLGVTADFDQPLVRLLDVGTLLLLLAGVLAACTWLKRSFLLVYLLAVVVGLMLGSLIKPMYQGVRHIMVGSPAFLLLIAWGIVYLWQLGKPVAAGRAMRQWPYRIPALLALAVALGGAALSLNNLYYNVNYAKDDFRALIRYVEQQAGDRDVILYNNAVLLPMHSHYQLRRDVTVTALPVYPYDATGVEEQLAQLSAAYERIWFVTDPPTDKRDATQRVYGWLDANMLLIDESRFPARTTEVKLLVYATTSPFIDTLPSDGRPLEVHWSDLPPLQGFRLDFAQPAALPSLWLELFWRCNGIPPAETHLRFSLRGQDGREWLSHSQALVRETLLAETAAGWRSGQLARLNYRLPVSVGTPPGRYTLMVQPLAGRDGPAVGEPEVLGEIELAASTAWPVSPSRLLTRQLPASPSLHFNNSLSLVAVRMPVTEVRPGHTLPLSLYWQAGELSIARLRYQLSVVGPDGQVLRQDSGVPGVEWLESWPAGALVRSETGLYFPPEARPGRYRLRWQLFDDETVVPVRPAWRPWYSQSVYLGHIDLEPWPLVRTLPADVNLLQAAYGSAIQLYGYELDRSAADVLHLTLYWQATAIPDGFYVSFVHLVSAESGEIVTQAGFIPVDGLRPTTGWRVGEVLTDNYTLLLPADLPPGDYFLNAGLYNPDNGERLPVTVQGELQADNQLTLTTLTLP